MANLRFMRMIVFMMLSLVMFSCENELHMTLPQGPEGKSSYDVWVEGVKNGTISWDKDNIDLNNYFLFLKGEDGAAGKSAYDIWKEEVAKGLDNPHNSGTNWSVNNTTLQDFWYYLTGAKGQNGSTPIIGSNGNWFIDGKDTGLPSKGNDGQNGSNGSNGQDGKDGSVVTIGSNGNWFIDGVDTTVPAFGKDGTNGQNGQNGSNGQNGVNGKSAYELWVEEVTKGLDNPHITGTLWPKDQTTTADFWEYLRGADGKDGEDGSDGKPGEAGKPGGDVIIIKGKPNVIAQYSQQEVSEYVRTTDGAVLYIVYDDQGAISPGAKVSGIPGIDPAITFTADEKGQFIIPKDSLPVDLAIANRFGTCQVNYKKSTGSQVTETSANNTYVPNKMHIRMILDGNIRLDWYTPNHYQSIPYRVERKTDPDKEWEQIPSYLGNLSQKFIAYELSNMNDPTSYTNTSTTYYSYSSLISTGSTIPITRLVKASSFVLNESYLWDEKDHYFNLVLESYYGEKPHANAVIKMAPIQYTPMIKNIKAYNYNSVSGFFSRMEGEIDFGVNNANVDQNLLFERTLISEPRTINGNTFNYYYPKLIDITTIQSTAIGLNFAVVANIAKGSSTIASPGFNLLTPYLNSDVVINSNNMYFKSFQIYSSYASTTGYIGQLREVDGVIKIVGTKNSTYNFPDIPVQQIP